MYRYLLYVGLILSYLAVSKAISPSEINMDYIQNEKSFDKVIKGNPVTVILIDMHATGFLFKTYYQKYRLVFGFQGVEEIIVRTSRDFALKNKINIGMSLFRRSENISEVNPLPPGSEYIGQSSYGVWKAGKDGNLYWKFYRPYRNLPRFFGWGKFKPDQVFYRELLNSKENKVPYYGTHNEFGEYGPITQKSFPHFFTNARKKRISLTELFYDYIKENY